MDQGIGCRLKGFGVTAVEDADQIIGTRLENTVQSLSVIRRPYLLSVSRADSDQLIRENDAGFQKIGIAMKLDIVLMEIPIIDTQQVRCITEIEASLISEVMDGQNCLAPPLRMEIILG